MSCTYRSWESTKSGHMSRLRCNRTHSYIRCTAWSPVYRVKHGTKRYYWRYSIYLGNPCRKRLPNRYGLRFRAGSTAVDLEKERLKKTQIIAFRATVIADYEPKIEATASENDVPCQNVQLLLNGSTVRWCYVHTEVENLQSRDICLDFVATGLILI